MLTKSEGRIPDGTDRLIQGGNDCLFANKSIGIRPIFAAAWLPIEDREILVSVPGCMVTNS